MKESGTDEKFQGVIYEFIYESDGRKYVGKTTQLIRRIEQHIKATRKNSAFHGNTREHYNQIAKIYGKPAQTWSDSFRKSIFWDAYKFRILENGYYTGKELADAERFWIVKRWALTAFGGLVCDKSMKWLANWQKDNMQFARSDDDKQLRETIKKEKEKEIASGWLSQRMTVVEISTALSRS